MKRTIAIKLPISQEENQALLELQEQFSAACNRAAKSGQESGETNRIRLHHLCYHSIRKDFPALGSQMACNAVAKASQALKALKKPREVLFRNTSSIHYDKR